MPLGLNNPLVRRIRRHRQMSILFRAPDLQPSESLRYQFVQPMIERPVQLPINARPVEPDSPPLTVQDAISRAEAFVPHRISQEGGQLLQPSEAEGVSVQKSADLTPQPSMPLQPQTVEPTPEPGEAAGEEPSDRHSQDWDGEWGRLKNILRKHEEKTVIEGPREESERVKPKEPKPRPKTLSEVQRRVARGGRYPKAGERRRAKIEYVSPGQPVTIPEQPAEVPIEPVTKEVEEDAAFAVADAAVSSGVEERSLSLETGTDVGDTEAAIQRAEESPEDSVETEEATPSAVEFEPKPEATPSAVEFESKTDATPSAVEFESKTDATPSAVEFVSKPDATPSAVEFVSKPDATPSAAEFKSKPEASISDVPTTIETSVQREVSKEAAEKSGEVSRDEGADFGDKKEAELTPSAEPKPEDLPGVFPEEAQPVPSDSTAPAQDSLAAAIQKAEIPAAETKSQDKHEVDQPIKEFPEIVDGRERPPAISVSSEGEVQEIDITTPEEAEPEPTQTVTDEVVSAIPAEAEDATLTTRSPVATDIPLAVQRQPAEEPGEGPSEGYDDQLQAAIQRAEAPSPTPAQVTEPGPETHPIPSQVDQAESEPEERASFGQRLFDRARRLFSREEPPAAPERPGSTAPIPGQPAAEVRTPEVPVVKASLAAPLSAQTFAEPAPVQEGSIETQDLGPDISESKLAVLPVVEQQVATGEIPQAEKTIPDLSTPPIQAIQRAEAAAVKPVQPTTEPSPVSGERPKLTDDSIQTPVQDDSGGLEPDVEVITPEIVEDPRQLELTEEPEATLDAAEAIEKAEQAVPLEEAWPVQRIRPTEPVGETVTQKLQKELAARTDVAQRKSAAGDSSSDQVDEALRQVKPEVYTDSSIELITPRKPRPKLKPTPEQIVDEAIVKAEAPTPDISRKREGATADTQEPPFQRIPFTGLPVVPGLSPAEIVSPSPETAPHHGAPHGASPDPSQYMVPTEVGELPSDLWRLIGQRPPQQPAALLGDPGRDDAQVQREPSDVASAIAVAERPALDEVISQDVVQRVDSRQASDSLTTLEPTETEAEDVPSEEAEIDVEELARKVYSRLKTKLRIERERGRGRF